MEPHSAFSLPNEKKEKFKTFQESILAEKKVCVKTLQKFAGKVISFALAVPAAKLYTREIIANISKGLRSSRPVELTKDLRGEIEHWRFIDSLQEPLRWSLEKHYSVSISSDASNSGWGGIFVLWKLHNNYTCLLVRRRESPSYRHKRSPSPVQNFGNLFR